MRNGLERGFLRLAMATGAGAWFAVVSAEAGVFRPWLVLLGTAGVVALVERALARSTRSSDPSRPGHRSRPSPNSVSVDERGSVGEADAPTSDGATGDPGSDGEAGDHPAARGTGELASTGRWLGDDTVLAALVLMGLLLFAAFRFLPPFDTTLWAGDSSVYMSYARQIERNHALDFEDPLVAQIPVELRRELFLNREAGEVSGSYSRLPGGFLIPDIERSRVTAGFAPLYPLLIALARGTFGPRAGLFVTPLFGVLAVAAVFFVGRRLGGPVGGALAAGLLALSLPQMWFARFGMPAVVAQYFVFAGLLALLAGYGRRRPELAAMGGVLFGLAVFTKFDLFFVLPLATMGFAAWTLLRAGRATDQDSTRIDEGRVVASFCFAFGLLLVHNVLHYLLVPSDYELFIEDMLSSVQARWSIVPSGGPGAWWPLLGGTLAATGASFVWLRRGAADRVARVAGTGMLLLIAGYVAAYLSVSTNRMSETLAWLAWYLSWPVLALVALAAWRLYRRRRAECGAQQALLLILLIAAAMHYVYDPHEATRHLWSMRRFVPVVIPAALLMASAFATVAVGRAPRRRRPWLLAGAMLVGGILVGAPNLPLIGTRPWRGATEQLREAARSFPAGAVVLVSDDLAGTHIATALTYLHDTDAIVVRPFYSRPGVLQQLTTGLLRGGHRVYLALGDDFHVAGPRLALERHQDLEIHVPVLETTVARPPQRTVVLTASVQVFRVSERLEGQRAYVDVGNRVEDTLFEMSGLHAPERDESAFDGSFRWTDGQAVIGVPAARQLELLLDGARPAGVAPAVVSIWVGDRPVVEGVTLANSPQVVRVDNPVPDAGGRIRLNIASTAFVPADVGLSTDSRRLGVRLYGVRLVPPACCDD